jgi:hypothetical protein
MSVSEDLRSTTPNIDFNLCLYQNSSPSPTRVQLHSDDDPNLIYHIVFARDVAPYQISQNQLNNYYQDAKDARFKKKKYTIRIQGVKTDRDKKYASILPEIKVSFSCKNISIKCKLKTVYVYFFFSFHHSFCNKIGLHLSSLSLSKNAIKNK